MNYTTIEQSKNLLELGLNPESADMLFPWNGYSNIEIPVIGKTGNSSVLIPCWSVGALLEVMPVILKLRYRAFLTPHSVGYCCAYSDCSESFHVEDEKTAINACYKMVVWLLENNYIKKGE